MVGILSGTGDKRDKEIWQMLVGSRIQLVREKTGKISSVSSHYPLLGSAKMLGYTSRCYHFSATCFLSGDG